MAGEVALIARLLFSEAIKKNPDMAVKDATAIAHVVKNRLNRPQRFGETLEDVTYAPNKFSGVGSSEWQKIETNKLTPQENEKDLQHRGARLL